MGEAIATAFKEHVRKSCGTFNEILHVQPGNHRSHSV